MLTVNWTGASGSLLLHSRAMLHGEESPFMQRLFAYPCQVQWQNEMGVLGGALTVNSYDLERITRLQISFSILLCRRPELRLCCARHEPTPR